MWITGEFRLLALSFNLYILHAHVNTQINLHILINYYVYYTVGSVARKPVVKQSYILKSGRCVIIFKYFLWVVITPPPPQPKPTWLSWVAVTRAHNSTGTTLTVSHSGYQGSTRASPDPQDRPPARGTCVHQSQTWEQNLVKLSSAWDRGGVSSSKPQKKVATILLASESVMADFCKWDCLYSKHILCNYNVNYCPLLKCTKWELFYLGQSEDYSPEIISQRALRICSKEVKGQMSVYNVILVKQETCNQVLILAEGCCFSL